MELFSLFQRSFKKLKASVYLDKTQPVLRDKLVRYESSVTDVEKSLKKLSERFCNENSWVSYKEELLSSIKALTFPKALKESNTNIVINRSVDEAVVDKRQFFFDGDVEIQILGVAWILTFGKIIDKRFSDNIYGYRLREYKGDSDTSPYLFYPYFSKYEKWRDQGLECAKRLLENGKDVLVFTMDVKSYFHSVDINKEAFNKIEEDCQAEIEGIEEPFRTQLHEFIFEVMQRYSSIFKTDRIFLPIGFLPSNIIANWYLENLDRAIINAWNPSYYGRYVDDILIVDKVEKEGAVRKVLGDKDAERKLLRHFLYDTALKKDSHILIEQYKCNRCKTISKKDSCEKCKVKMELIYGINRKSLSIHGSPKPELEIQNKKVGMYFFDKEGSKALITCFQKNIARNSSIFKFLPEDDEAVEYDDYSGIFKLEYSDTINKLSGVKGISLDRYELSKFLGRKFKVGSLIRDKIESKFLKDLKRIIDTPAIIENYRFWESILNYFVVSSSYNGLKAYIGDVLKAIGKVDETKVSDEIEILDVTKVLSVMESLKKYFISIFNRVFALIWGNTDDLVHCKKIIEDCYGDALSLDEIQLRYCRSRMVNKYLIPGSLDSIIDSIEKKAVESRRKAINLTDFKDVLVLYNESVSDKPDDYKYYPYIVTPQELLFDNFIKYTIKSESCTPLNIPTGILKDIYYKKNFSFTDNANSPDGLPEINSINKGDLMAFKVGSKRMKEVRVAIANVPLNVNTLVHALRGLPDRSYKRYNCLAKVVNQAIKEKADMLVLPEAYVPMEWIPALARISANNQIALVFGVEHIANSNGKVFNYTASILPYSKEQEYRFAHIVLHQKKYFAPAESERIRGFRMEPEEGKKDSDLIVWNDLWFATLCCYELASIHDRCKLFNYIDMIIAVEWNRDVQYFSSIIESLSRDLHCYCVQVNSSRYGDNRITQPASTELKDLVRFKGGINETIVIETIKIDSLRRFQEMEYNLQKENGSFKPTPPIFKKGLVVKKMRGDLWEYLHEEEPCQS